MMFKLFSTLLLFSLCAPLVFAAQNIDFFPGKYAIKSVLTHKYVSVQSSNSEPVVLADSIGDYGIWTVIAAGEGILWRIQNNNTLGWTWENPRNSGLVYASPEAENVKPSDWVFSFVRESDGQKEYTIREWKNRKIGPFWHANDDGDTIETVPASEETWVFVPAG